jgi:aminoglycoside phosphotransferase (APT) family kinase protein|tara:strand:+ start:3865 stop:4890 length:1026 start_codon:yes stop_codon:yes gene_type:complete
MTDPNEDSTHQIEERLIAYLRDELGDPSIDYASPLTQLHGGFDTSIYRFQLKGVGQKLAGQLVLRLCPEFQDSSKAIWESTVQNALAGEGYPVAAAHVVCTDKSVLGGAFFIMDFLPGEPMITATTNAIPVILAETHAALHRIDPAPLLKALTDQGIDQNRWTLTGRLRHLQAGAEELSWISPGINWLVDNRPDEPQRLAVCHGDFHAMNILMQDGKVSGVLDWPGFLIADPVLDVANTLLLIMVAYKQLASSDLGVDLQAMIGREVVSVDWEAFSRQYLDAYRAQLPLESTHIDYYRVLRGMMALVEGVEGQEAWRHPAIVNELIEFIHSVTDLTITVPS